MFPIVAGSALSNEGASVTTHDVAMPASVAAGDLLLGFIFEDGNTGPFTWDTAGGWVELADATISTVACMTIGYKIAAGGETTTAVTSTTGERSNHIALRVTGWHGTTPPEISAGATGTSANPDPDSLDPAGWGTEDTLWIAVAGVDEGNVTAYPLADNNIASETTLSAAYGAVCTAESAVGSLDPGTFTWSVSDSWRAYTLGIRPAAGAAAVSLVIPKRSHRLIVR